MCQIIFRVGTQGELMHLPPGSPPLWVALATACWREKPAGGGRSQRPPFRQIVGVLTAAQSEMKGGSSGGLSLQDGAGMEAWEAAEVLREAEYGCVAM